MTLVKRVINAAWVRPDWIGDVVCHGLILLLPREAPRGYGIGLPRSGTHTLAQSWPTQIARHEAFSGAIVPCFLHYVEGRMSTKRMQLRLTTRWRLMRTQFDVFHALHHVVDLLPSDSKSTKFILTVRDPIPWLISEISRNYHSQRIPVWRALESYRYGRYNLDKEAWDNEMSVCTDWPLRSYFRYWNDHIIQVSNYVAREKLIVLDVESLSARMQLIASECDLDSARLTLGHRSGNTLRKIPRDVFPPTEILQQLMSDECQRALSYLKTHQIVFPKT